MPSESATSPVFIVTGASRSIGEAVVQELMHRGESVLGVARNPDAWSTPLAEATSGSCNGGAKIVV